MLVSRWKPVCPECGYALRGLSAPRCPECGVDFPSPRKTFRRWAVRRIAWDRATRASFVGAYLSTLAVILILPWRAARGLSVPDNWHRCARWAIAHLAIVAFASAMLANGQLFPKWLTEQVWPPSFDPPHMYMLSDVPAGRMILWSSQSLVAWAIVVMFPAGLASLLSIAIPSRHRAAKLGGVKWSLYLLSINTVILGAWYGYYALNLPQVQATFPKRFTYTLPTPDPPVLLFAGAYAVWWAAGMAASPFNRARSFRTFFGFVVLYAASWALMTWGLFPAGTLSAVL